MPQEGGPEPMKAFEYVTPDSIGDAVSAMTQAGAKGKFLAGGIDLLGEMKDYIRTPDVVINLKNIQEMQGLSVEGKGLLLGALVTLSEIAEHPDIQKRYTALADAASVVGTPQIRHVGTLGGNLCQRPRCW